MEKVPAAVIAVVLLCTAATTASAGLAAHAAPTAPKLLSVSYGRFRPAGAPRAYDALKVRTRDAAGQVVSLEWQRVNPGGPSTPAGIADGGCGLAAKRNGAVGIWYLPMHLKAGSYRLRFKLTASSCDAARKLKRASKVVVIRVT